MDDQGNLVNPCQQKLITTNEGLFTFNKDQDTIRQDFLAELQQRRKLQQPTDDFFTGLWEAREGIKGGSALILPSETTEVKTLLSKLIDDFQRA